MFSKRIKPGQIAIRAILVTSLLAVSSANAADFVSHQSAFSDGSPYPGVSSPQSDARSDQGVAHDRWLEQQLTVSDGSSFGTVASVPTRGHIRVPPIRYASREADAERATDTNVAAVFGTGALTPDQNDLQSQLRISDGATE
ncbi:MAG: hypothetical protein M3Q32_04300 [Pseudomonadota bacterium]|nr:hypothetical protein [Burkholderiales bacterium]MDQ3195596.1 hypothetical protein [Pseudomonadota bacterium]